MSMPGLFETLLRGAHRDLAQAPLHPVLAQALDGLPGVGGGGTLSTYHRHLYEPFEAARQANPNVTFAEFLRTNPRGAYTLRKLLGPDQFTLVVESCGVDYFAARLRVLAAVAQQDAPFPLWLHWPHWGGPQVAITGDVPRVVPIDFPVPRRKGKNVHWEYPEWDEGRVRFWINLAYVELLRRFPGRQIPLSGNGVDLLRQLPTPLDPTPRPFIGVPGLLLSDVQVARIFMDGSAPPVQVRIMPAGSDAPIGFVRSEHMSSFGGDAARWELANRLGRPELADEDHFWDTIASIPEAADANRPPAGLHPANELADLSNAELVAIGRRDIGCPEVMRQGYEVEHTRGQRSGRGVERVLEALGTAVDGSLIRHLCGLCDPHNLTPVTPAEHAARDFFAYYSVIGGGPPRRNRARVAQDIYASPTGHPDYARAMNAFIAFAPLHLEPVARNLTTPAVLQAVQSANAEAIAAYNTLASNLNAAIRSYQMDPSLILRTFVNGSWQ